MKKTILTSMISLCNYMLKHYSKGVDQEDINEVKEMKAYFEKELNKP